MVEGFSKKYKLTKLVYCEQFSDIKDAISREKQIKAGSRKKKLEIIKASNPTLKDLYVEL